MLPERWRVCELVHPLAHTWRVGSHDTCGNDDSDGARATGASVARAQWSKAGVSSVRPSVLTRLRADSRLSAHHCDPAGRPGPWNER